MSRLAVTGWLLLCLGGWVLLVWLLLIAVTGGFDWLRDERD